MNVNIIIRKRKEEKMPTTQTKFIVVSLPRTGTKSILQMAKRMGLVVHHAPNFQYVNLLKRVDIMADTPLFRPSIISHMVDTEPNMKFIYVTKTADAWVKSMMKVGLSDNYNRMFKDFKTHPGSFHPHMITDLDSLEEILGGPFNQIDALSAFEKHEKDIRRIIPQDRLLIYNFSDGWKPFADFLGTKALEEEIPHLNQRTMTDKITD